MSSKLISFKQKGNFSKADRYFERLKNVLKLGILDKYGDKGVEALSHETPIDSGKTADSWYYRIERYGDKIKIVWLNSNVNDDVNIAIILQYGHATGTGGYVEGRDYINPAMQPVFDDIAKSAWKEIENL